MICFYFLYIYTVFLQCCFYSYGFYVNHRMPNKDIDCRDNSDMPVDWWYLYKPPAKSGPYLESGGNFTFITPQVVGRLQPSRTFINHNSMLQYTLAPLYKTMYRSSLALMSYGEKLKYQAEDDVMDSTSYGILFASSTGGVWLSHTIPNFPDITRSRPVISDKEYKNGHFMMCLTLDLKTLDLIGAAVNHTGAKINKLILPNDLRIHLPHWARIASGIKVQTQNTTISKLVTFTTRNKTLSGRILARGPDESSCLYKSFAKLQGIVLDIYNSNNKKAKPICEPTYSLRYFNQISLKFPDQVVHYINGIADNMSFGVSTGAAWQKQTRNIFQYWTCTGYHDLQEYFNKGAIITCVHDYSVWFAFDNLKTKEPKC